VTMAFAEGADAGVAADVIEVPYFKRKIGNRCTVPLHVTKQRVDAAFHDTQLPVTAGKEAPNHIRAPSELLCASGSDRTFAIEVKRDNEHNEPYPRNTRVLLALNAEAKAALRLEINAADGEKLKSAFPDVKR
jgi:hypothetical protein